MEISESKISDHLEEKCLKEINVEEKHTEHIFQKRRYKEK